jgi:hypothetical protein
LISNLAVIVHGRNTLQHPDLDPNKLRMKNVNQNRSVTNYINLLYSRVKRRDCDSAVVVTGSEIVVVGPAFLYCCPVAMEPA